MVGYLRGYAARSVPDAEQADVWSSYAAPVRSWRTILVPATMAWSLPTAMVLGLQPLRTPLRGIIDGLTNTAFRLELELQCSVADPASLLEELYELIE